MVKVEETKTELPTVRNTVRFCPNCGMTLDASDRFCPDCGYTL
jgi:ribosomal protein S27AE